MRNQAVSKKSDLVLSIAALIVVGGLCIKGAHSLYNETSSNKKMVSTMHDFTPTTKMKRTTAFSCCIARNSSKPTLLR